MPRFSSYASFVLNFRKMDVPFVSVQPYSMCSIFPMDMSSQKRPQFPFLSYPTTRRGHSADNVTFLLPSRLHRRIRNRRTITAPTKLSSSSTAASTRRVSSPPVSTSNTLKSSLGSTCSSPLEVSELSSSYAPFFFLVGFESISYGFSRSV